jgi:hypothetical protein
MVDTLTSIIRSSTLWIVNQSSIPTMIKRLQLLKGNTVEAQTFADKLSIIFATISKCCPPILKPHVHEFYKALNDTQNPRLVEVALQAMASVARADKSVKPSDRCVSLLTLFPPRTLTLLSKRKYHPKMQGFRERIKSSPLEICRATLSPYQRFKGDL